MKPGIIWRVVDGRTKSVRAEFKADGKPGEFTALFSVFDVLDRDGDIVRKGAFAPAFENDPNPPVVWTHLWDIPPIGETLDAEETEKGARGHGQLFVDDHPVAKQVYVALKAGALKQYSYAYQVADGGFILRDPADDEKSVRFDGLVRELTEFASIFEWGPTLAGANPETFTESGPKSLELLLGVKAVDMRRWLGIEDEDDEFDEKLAKLDQLVKGLKAGARHSKRDAETIQQLHDLTVDLGVKCVVPEVEDSNPDDDEEKSKQNGGGEVDLLTLEPLVGSLDDVRDDE
jgi:HK97 family phage prohead protease